MQLYATAHSKGGKTVHSAVKQPGPHFLYSSCFIILKNIWLTEQKYVTWSFNLFVKCTHSQDAIIHSWSSCITIYHTILNLGHLDQLFTSKTSEVSHWLSFCLLTRSFITSKNPPIRFWVSGLNIQNLLFYSIETWTFNKNIMKVFLKKFSGVTCCCHVLCQKN